MYEIISSNSLYKNTYIQMINQGNVRIILVGMTRPEGITVMHEDQGQAFLPLSQLLHKRLYVPRFCPIGRDHTLDQVSAVVKT